MIGWFNQNFIKTTLIEVKYGKILRDSFKNRSDGDYAPFILFEKDDVLYFMVRKPVENSKPGSDDDVLILVNKEILSYKNVASITDPIYGIELKSGVLISPLVYT